MLAAWLIGSLNSPVLQIMITKQITELTFKWCPAVDSSTKWWLA